MRLQHQPFSHPAPWLSWFEFLHPHSWRRTWADRTHDYWWKSPTNDDNISGHTYSNIQEAIHASFIPCSIGYPNIRRLGSLFPWVTHCRLSHDGVKVKELAQNTHCKKRAEERVSMCLQLWVTGILTLQSLHLLQTLCTQHSWNPQLVSLYTKSLTHTSMPQQILPLHYY